MSWLDAIKFNDDGLIPAIAQDHLSKRVLMVAWMNAESLSLTVESKTAVYFSRSRQKLWKKGETSGHIQQVHNIRLDCDADVILLSVTQLGNISCHTGRESCFYLELDMTAETGATEPVWQAVDPVLKDPKQIYAHNSTDNNTHNSADTIATALHAQEASSSIFNSASESQNILSKLDEILAERKEANPDSSYVSSLYHKGLNKVLEKVGEESFETVIAAKDYQTALDSEQHSEPMDDTPSLAALKNDLIYEVADVWFHTMVMLAWFNIPSEVILTELARRFGLSGIAEKASREQ